VVLNPASHVFAFPTELLQKSFGAVTGDRAASNRLPCKGCKKVGRGKVAATQR